MRAIKAIFNVVFQIYKKKVATNKQGSGKN